MLVAGVGRPHGDEVVADRARCASRRRRPSPARARSTAAVGRRRRRPSECSVTHVGGASSHLAGGVALEGAGRRRPHVVADLAAVDDDVGRARAAARRRRTTSRTASAPPSGGTQWANGTRSASSRTTPGLLGRLADGGAAGDVGLAVARPRRRRRPRPDRRGTPTCRRRPGPGSSAASAPRRRAVRRRRRAAARRWPPGSASLYFGTWRCRRRRG